MSQTIEIVRNEQGVIRVFAVNLPAAEMRSALENTPKADLARRFLAAPHLDTTGTEIFPVSDLGGIGLAAYLREGYAVPQAALTPQEAKLDALDGYVMLVFSKCFGGQEMTLPIGPNITLIGTFSEFAPDNTAKPLSAQSAAPYTGASPETAQAPKSRGMGSIMVIILAALLLIVGWLLIS